jgi:hypothetical protein
VDQSKNGPSRSVPGSFSAPADSHRIRGCLCFFEPSRRLPEQRRIRGGPGRTRLLESHCERIIWPDRTNRLPPNPTTAERLNHHQLFEKRPLCVALRLVICERGQPLVGLQTSRLVPARAGEKRELHRVRLPNSCVSAYMATTASLIMGCAIE